MFYIGFQKVAALDHSNQGFEFNLADTNNTTSNVGPGGMTPQGIESYQPAPKQKAGGKDGKKEKLDVAQFLMHKGASVKDMARSKDVPGFSSGMVRGLKYDNETVTDDGVEHKESYKKYRRALKS